MNVEANIKTAETAQTTPERILIYGINYTPEPIGVGRYSGELGSYLGRQGVIVDVVTAVPHYPGWSVSGAYRNRYCTETLDGVRIWRCPLFLKKQMRGIWRVLAPLSFAITSAPVAFWLILKKRPRTVLCIEPTLLSAPAAILAAKLIGARTVLHVQDLEMDAAFAIGHLNNGLIKRLALFLEARLMRVFDVVITISFAMRKQLEAKGIPSNRLEIIRNWVDLEKIRPLAVANSYLGELGLEEKDFVVQYAGNIGAKQALHVVLEAAARLVSRPNIQFVIAGEGPEKASLQSRFGHLPNVRFLGLQPEESLCEFLNLASLHIIPQDAGAADLVLPSKLGGMLASGKPVLAMADAETELGQFLKGAAIIVPTGNVDAVVNAIDAQSMNPVQFRDASNNLVAQLDSKVNLPTFSVALFSRNERPNGPKD